MRIVGLLEVMVGFGCAIGPVIGSGLFAFVGYEKTFYCFGSANIILSALLYLLFPKNANTL